MRSVKTNDVFLVPQHSYLPFKVKKIVRNLQCVANPENYIAGYITEKTMLQSHKKTRENLNFVYLKTNSRNSIKNSKQKKQLKPRYNNETEPKNNNSECAYGRHAVRN